MLKIRSLTKSFGAVTALNDINLDIEQGEMVAIIGRSGSGKSTLLRCVNRLETATEGQIWQGETDITRLKGSGLNSWRSRCAMIFQQFQLVPRLDVLTNVLVGSLHKRSFLAAMVKHFPAEERARAIIELSRLDMDRAALQRAETLSGGQQQRVAIARVMMQNPDIILADEPTASLDPRNTHAVMKSLTQINAERGITMIVNLHAIDIAREYCDRVIGLRDGHCVFDAPVSELSDAALAEIYDGAEPAFADEPGTDRKIETAA